MRVADHALHHAAEKEVLDPRTAVSGDDKQVGMLLLGQTEDLGNRYPVCHARAMLHLRQRRVFGHALEESFLRVLLRQPALLGFKHSDAE